MKKLLLILCLALFGLPLLWYGALTSERLAALRAVAQLVHLPTDFFVVGEPSYFQRASQGRYVTNFIFSPKYTGRYQILVKPVPKKYGGAIEAESILACVASGKQFQVRATEGRIEFDRALKLGFVGRLLTFDTTNNAAVGFDYQCKLSVESVQDLSLQQSYVRKITDN